ncbi:MAG: rod-binding protein [Deltaproteobacteria bacterium]|nr:rod-binding protein [Deltaproteobacteria bacterium]
MKILPAMNDLGAIDAGGQSTRIDEQLKRERSLKKACADFESIFVYYMFKTMRQTVKSGGAIGSFTGKDTFDMMMDQKVAEELTRRGDGLGLQKILFNQLSVPGMDRPHANRFDLEEPLK